MLKAKNVNQIKLIAICHVAVGSDITWVTLFYVDIDTRRLFEATSTRYTCAIRGHTVPRGTNIKTARAPYVWKDYTSSSGFIQFDFIAVG